MKGTVRLRLILYSFVYLTLLCAYACICTLLDKIGRQSLTFRLEGLRRHRRSADALRIRGPLAGGGCALLLPVLFVSGAVMRRLRCVCSRRLLC